MLPVCQLGLELWVYYEYRCSGSDETYHLMPEILLTDGVLDIRVCEIKKALALVESELGKWVADP